MSATEIQESLESSTQDVQDTGVKLRRVPAVAQNIHASVKVIISTTYTKCYKKVAISINSVKFVSEGHMRNMSFHHAALSRRKGTHARAALPPWRHVSLQRFVRACSNVGVPACMEP